MTEPSLHTATGLDDPGDDPGTITGDDPGTITDGWTVTTQPDGSVLQTNSRGERTTLHPDGRSVAEISTSDSWSHVETWPDGRSVTITGGLTPTAGRWTTTVEHVPSPDGAWRDTTTWSDGRSEVASYAPDGDLTGFSRVVPAVGGGTWTHEYDEWGRKVGSSHTDAHGRLRWAAASADRADDGQWGTPWGVPTRSVEINFPPPDGRAGQVDDVLVDRSGHREVTTETYPDGSTITRTVGWRADPPNDGSSARPETWHPHVIETVHTQLNPDGSITVRTYDDPHAPEVATYDVEGRMTMRGGWDAERHPTQETFEYFEDGGHSRTTYGEAGNVVHLYDEHGVMTGGYVWDHENGWNHTWSGSDRIGPEGTPEPAPPEPLRTVDRDAGDHAMTTRHDWF